MSNRSTAQGSSGLLVRLTALLLAAGATAPAVGQDLFDRTTYSPLPSKKPLRFKAADMDGDGDLDLVAVMTSSYEVLVMLNDGAGGFSRGAAVPATPVPVCIGVGDLDGDGDPDVVTGSEITNYVIELFQNNGGTLTSAGTFPVLSVVDLEVSRVDGDLLPDLAILGAGNPLNCSLPSYIRMYRNLGGFQFLPQSSFAIGCNPQDLATGDVDGSFELDLLTADRLSSQVSVWLSDGAGGFVAGQPVPVRAAVMHVHASDLDGNGFDDILVTHGAPSHSDVAIQWSGDIVPSAPQHHDQFLQPGPVRASDFVGDGDRVQDLAVAYGRSSVPNGDLLVYRGFPGRRFSTGISLLTGGDPRDMIVADFDPTTPGLEIAVASANQNLMTIHRRTSWPWPQLEFSIREGVAISYSPTTLKVGGGLPRAHLTIAFVEINGSPTFTPLVNESFDASGVWQKTFDVPPGLVGLQVKFAAFGMDGAGRFSRSNNAEMFIQR